jgi:hypothetical protein
MYMEFEVGHRGAIKVLTPGREKNCNEKKVVFI